MNRFYPHIARARFFGLSVVMAVAAALLSAPMAHARTIDASAMSRAAGVWATAKAPALPIEQLSSRGAFIAAILPYGLVLESNGHVRVPYGYYAYSPLSYDPLSLNPNDPAYGGVRCNPYFDNEWMTADAGPNSFEAGIQSDPNDVPPLPAPVPPIAKSSPGAFASGMGGPGMDDAGAPVDAEAFDEPAAPVYCPSARQSKSPGLDLAHWRPRRAAVGLCSREIDGEGEKRDRLASARICEWRCETRSDGRLLAGFCPLPRPGNELEFAFFDVHPPRAEATTRRRAPRGKSRAAAQVGTARPCGRRCDTKMVAAPSAGFCPRGLQANALEFTPAPVDARRAGARTWIAFAVNNGAAAPVETPGLCVRPREAPVVAPAAGFCARSPLESWPELARLSTCGFQEAGEGAAAARQTPRLCEWRREPRAPLAGMAEFCPNPRLKAAVQRDPLDFSPVPASVTTAELCRRVACAILVFDADGLRPARLPAPGDGSGFPAPALGVVDLGHARTMLAAANVNGAGVWPSVVTGTQKRYCPMGTAPLTYAQFYFLFGSSSPVPEPSTWALLLVAFLGLGGLRWRRLWRGGEIG
jgi:hypothetical protein